MINTKLNKTLNNMEQSNKPGCLTSAGWIVFVILGIISLFIKS